MVSTQSTSLGQNAAYAGIRGICAQFERLGHIRELKKDIAGSECKLQIVEGHLPFQGPDEFGLPCQLVEDVSTLLEVRYEISIVVAESKECS
ncbi:hypothetical protein ACROYT_G001397 [Oculina patagonica]